jgi:hypothetical protein
MELSLHGLTDEGSAGDLDGPVPDQDKAKQAQLSVLHNMMACYAKSTIAGKEFGYYPFHK